MVEGVGGRMALRNWQGSSKSAALAPVNSGERRRWSSRGFVGLAEEASEVRRLPGRERRKRRSSGSHRSVAVVRGYGILGEGIGLKGDLGF